MNGKIIMKYVYIFIAVVSLLLACSPSSTPTGPTEHTDTAITLSTTASSAIATIVHTPDKAVYASGDTVRLSVTTNPGYTFTGWTGDTVSTATTLVIVMNKAKTIYANFRNSSGKTVFSVVTSATNGSVTLAPAGGVYDSGTTVFAYARPDYGFVFASWSGAITSHSQLDTIKMSRNALIIAAFSLDPNAVFNILYVNPVPANGKIVMDPPGILSLGGRKYKPGTDVTLTATPDSGYQLTAWGGDYSDTLIGIASFSVTMDRDHTVSATFKKLPDGVKWTSRTSGNLNGLISVVWANNQFVVVGNSGTILTSPDGVTWTSRTSGVTSCLNCVIWTGTMLVCVGDDGTILTSVDGKTWDKKNSTTTYHLQSVAWAGAQFVAVGGYIRDSGTNYNCLLTSPDGTTWTNHSSGRGVWYSVVWNGTMLVGAGFDFDYTTVSDYSTSFIMFSSNGTSWTDCATYIPTEASFTSIVWAGTQFVAVGGSRSSQAYSSAYTSLDGNTWREGTIPTENFMNAVTWTGSTLVAVGENGSIYTSQDAKTWTSRVSGTTDAIFGVTWTGSRLIAVGYGGMILTSP
jgi:uncharacterized repeat protein (TIGR02543 family)